MIKRFMAAVFAALTLALVLSGCAAGRNAERAVTVMGKKEDVEKSYMQNVFSRYESLTGKKLKVIEVDTYEFETEARKAFEEGRGPDVLLHFHNADLSKFDIENDFLYLNDRPWTDDLTDGARAYCEDGDGNLLGLPFWENSVSGCYYNKTLLDSLGLKPAANQAEFDMLCQALADTGCTPICWPADGYAWMVQFALDPIFADDPELLEALNAGKTSYSEIPAVHDLVQWISDAEKKGWFGADYLNTGWDGISEAMSSGRAAMTFIWDTWFYTDMAADGKYGVDDFALMPVFMNTADSGTYEGGNLNMMMVNKNSDNIDAALEFLDFCASPENYNAAFDGIATVSCFKGQTTNVQSKMVTDAEASVAAHGRVSTAASRIVGYSADDVVEALRRLFKGRLDVDGCIEFLDEKRIEAVGEESE